MRKIILTILLILLIPFICSAGVQDMLKGALEKKNGAAAPSECTGKLICQNFEGTGYDNSESWTETIGTNGIIDEDDTTATVLRGSQQLKIYSGDNGKTSSTYAGFTVDSDTTTYAHFRYKTTDATPSADRIIATIRATTEILCTVYLETTSEFAVIASGGTKANGTTTSSDNTMFHIWVEYTEGTGSNGTCSLYVSATATKPSVEASSTDGASTATPNRFYLQQGSGSSTGFFDQVLVDDADIGDVAE